MNIRMRQICLVARELAPVVDALESVLELAVCYRDPAVGTYGLENALFAVGNGFLEVVAPVREATAAGRFLERRGGDGGYMVITQVPDLVPRRARCDALGVRVVNEIGHGEYRELQLHPRDVGAAILSFSWQAGGQAADGPWHPAGPKSTLAPRSRLTRALTGAELQSDDPERLARRWSEILELPVTRDARGQPVIALDDARLRFVTSTDGRGEGLAGLDLDCADRARVLAAARARGAGLDGDAVVLCGVRFHL